MEGLEWTVTEIKKKARKPIDQEEIKACEEFCRFIADTKKEELSLEDQL